MDMRLIAVLVGVVIAVGAALAITSEDHSTRDNTTQGNMQTTRTSASGSDKPGASIEGTWSGTYTGRYGSGTWKWIIKHEGQDSYIGCIMVSGVYNSSDWIPLTVTVEGDRITLGAIGVGVTFSGSISGSTATGTWTLAGGRDSGTWTGEKTGPAGELPCLGGTAENQTSTGTEAHGTCNSVPAWAREPLESAVNAVKKVLPGSPACGGVQEISGGVTATIYFNGSAGAAALADMIASELAASGWSNAMVQYADNSTAQIVAGPFRGRAVAVSIYVSVEETGGDVVVQVLRPLG